FYGAIYLRNELPECVSESTKIKVIKEYDRYPGLLALNRMLYAYLCDYTRLDISITGVNYYLSNSIYSSTYLNIVKKEGYKKNHKLDLMSLVSHDLLFNFMFTKRLVQSGVVTVSDSIEFKNIISMPVSDYCTRFVGCNLPLK
ncbi:MAG: hypothetical protein H8E98_07055, partial [Bacteroidetes bacterium]|nr:hypothetical protein [Bacteroidota bacterium]